MSEPPLLEFSGLDKAFGAIRALKGVSFTVPKGSLTILAGADGAGKSTLFRILVGRVRADRGKVLWRGSELGKDFGPVTSCAGYMPERFSLYTDLSVNENLDFFAAIHNVPKARRDDLKHRLLKKTGMLPFSGRRAGALSGGMKQKLALSAILLSSPELIILDEPTTGVDPLSRMEFFAIIEELKAEGKTILLSTPTLDEAEHGDRVVFLRRGRVIGEGEIAALRREFPARLWKIVPQDNPLEVLDRLSADPRLSSRLYLRGQSLRYLEEEGAPPPGFPGCRQEQVPPTLEDIYLAKERLSPAEEDHAFRH